MTRAQLSAGLEKARLRGHDAHVAGDRLDDERGDRVAALLEQRREGVDIVVLDEEGVCRRPLRDARAVGQRERQHAAAGGRQEGVRMAVVAADELHDLLAPGVAASHTDGAHGRLGAGVHHAHHLDRRDGPADEASELDLDGRRRAEARAVVDDGMQSAEHLRMAPAEDHRSPGRDEVDVLVAVDVPDVGALAARHEDGVRHADPLHGAHRRVDPARDVLERLLVQTRRRVQLHALLRPLRTFQAGDYTTRSQGKRRVAASSAAHTRS